MDDSPPPICVKKSIGQQLTLDMVVSSQVGNVAIGSNSIADRCVGLEHSANVVVAGLVGSLVDKGV